ncbi:MAG: gliding motility lipoprotein GldH [Ferruginibacter sp.]|nr:gliding motility lipoprotein GldH [Ferruginibacter sp.]
MNFFLKKSFKKIAYTFLLPLFFLTACKNINVFEKNTSIPNMQWQNNFNATGSFNITDTVSTYNMYIVLRHTDAYLYNNIWLNAGLEAPGDTSLQFQKINLSLGSDAQGWGGVGMNDIWEVRKLISGTPKRFIRAGEYTFTIAQLMRDNPLQHIISAGLRLEKAK